MVWDVPTIEDEMYVLLGLRNEDEGDGTGVNATTVGAHDIDEDDTSEDNTGVNAHGLNATGVDGGVDGTYRGATILVDDLIPEEHHVSYDRENPKMERCNMYPSMKEFRLAIR